MPMMCRMLYAIEPSTELPHIQPLRSHAVPQLPHLICPEGAAQVVWSLWRMGLLVHGDRVTWNMVRGCLWMLVASCGYTSVSFTPVMIDHIFVEAGVSFCLQHVFYYIFVV
jgi:hypothetical protein